MLRQTPSTSRPTSNSTVRLPANKKGPVIQLAQRSPNPSRASSSPSALTYSTSSSSTTNTEPDIEVDLSATSIKLDMKIEPVVLPSSVKRRERRT